jgi:hypothetical protein
MKTRNNDPASAQRTRMMTHDFQSRPMNPERVEDRARQIAGKDGRQPENVTEKDRQQAWSELRDEQGTGAIDADVLENRARELAVIDGRTEEEVTDADRKRAWLELHDQDMDLQSRERRGDLEVPRNPGDVSVKSGHKEPRKKAPDEAVLPEVEAEEGVQEAEHDTLLKASREEPGENRK